MFLFSASYQDVATLGTRTSNLLFGRRSEFVSLACLPHYTSGQTYFYPAFNAAKSEDAIKFAHEFGTVLAMPIMLEAVMRVRATKGQCLSAVHLLLSD